MVTRIRDLARPIEPVAPGLSASGAMRRFNLMADGDVLPVARDGVPLGLLKRRSVLEWLAGVRLTTDEAKVKVAHLMIDTPVISEADAAVAYVASQKGGALADGVIAVVDGLYAGYIAPRDLLSCLSEETVARAKALKSFKTRHTAERDQLERRLKEQSRFLSVLSHEIRTPLTGVLGVADLLRDSGLSKDSRELAQTISSSGRVLERLLSDLLDLSRLEAGKMPVSAEAFSLDEFAADVRRLWTQQVEAKGVSLSVQCRNRLSRRIEGDAVRLRQILFNLVSNAVKFTQSGTVSVDLMVRHRREGGLALQMTVTDTGPGIAPKDKARLFEAFEQASPETVSKFGGSGLGLTIAKSLTERLGGSITIADNPSGGAVFTVACPVRRAGPRLAVENAPRKTGNIQLGRLLVADDHDVSRLVMDKALSAAGWSVDTAHTANDAWLRVQETRYQAVLLDLRFGQHSGIEFARQLRQKPGPNRDAKLIAVTADVSDEIRHACQQAGFDGFAGKPIRPRELVAYLIDVILAHGGLDDAGFAPAASATAS